MTELEKMEMELTTYSSIDQFVKIEMNMQVKDWIRLAAIAEGLKEKKNIDSENNHTFSLYYLSENIKYVLKINKEKFKIYKNEI